MNGKYADVTIILPAYNVEDYIDEALASVVEQTLPPRQVIVVDDGSTDGTLARIKRFQRHHSIELVIQDNAGCGPARNTAVPLAVSEYLYFFDADDRLDREFLSRIQQTIEHGQRPDLVVFSGRPFVSDGFVPPLSFDYRRGLSLPVTDGITAMVRLLERGAFYSQVSLYLVRRQYWNDTGLKFPAGFHQDEDVLVPLFSHAAFVVVMDDVFFHRRVRPQSTMTMTKTCGHLEARARNVGYALNALARVPSSNRTLRKLLRKRCEMFANAYIDVAEALGERVRLGLLVRVAYRRRKREFTKRVRSQVWRSLVGKPHAS